MSKVISITNQKGGVGKTTTAQHLALGLALKGKRVLLIDMDGQHTLTNVMKASKEYTILDVITGKAAIFTAQQKINDNLFFISSKPEMYNMGEIVNGVGREYKLRDGLEPLINSDQSPDYIIIDTPPALSLQTFSALAVADYVIVTVNTELPSIEGLTELEELTIPSIKKYVNPKLSVLGILITRYGGRSIHSKQITEYSKTIAEKYNTRVFKTVIRERVAVTEAYTKRTNVYDYAPRNEATADYMAFTDEIISLTGGKNEQR